MYLLISFWPESPQWCIHYFTTRVQPITLCCSYCQLQFVAVLINALYKKLNFYILTLQTSIIIMFYLKLSYKIKWAILITLWLSSVRLSVNLSHILTFFPEPLDHFKLNLAQSTLWQKELWKLRTTPLFKGR